MSSSKTYFDNSGKWNLVPELGNKLHRHLTWLPEHEFSTFLLTHRFVLQFFVEINYIQQCLVLNTFNEHILRKKLIYCNNSLGLYTHVFKENLEDTDFDVEQFSG